MSPSELPLLELLALLALLAPALALLLVGVTLLLGLRPSERLVARSAASSLSVSLLATLVLAVGMAASGVPRLQVDLGPWFELAHHAFRLDLVVDHLTIPYMLLTSLLLGLTGLFSVRYLHREPGFARFFLLLLAFAVGMLLIAMAGSLDLLVIGWELVGLSSALLIGFFQERRPPLRNALRTFAVYRVCDVGLLTAAVLLHHLAGTSEFEALFPGQWPEAGTRLESGATAVALCLVFATLGKSAQVPFSGWLPRAMEGPTPSSAIFYGALSIHAGAYLLLRVGPLLAQSPLASWTLVAFGLLSAAHASFVGRVQTEVKSVLAYSSMVQVGLILAEIGLGLRQLALVHVVGHACLRTLQLLTAPSLLRQVEQLRADERGLAPTASAPPVLPASLWRWLYALALRRGHHDTVLEWYLVRPLLRALEGLDALERRLTAGPQERLP